MQQELNDMVMTEHASRKSDARFPGRELLSI